MGDILLTTPVVRALKMQIPAIEIHFLVRNKFAAVIENNPYIDQIIYVEKRAKEALEKIYEGNYDYIIDLHSNRRSRIFRKKCRVESMGFPKLNLKKLILTRLKINLLPDTHIVNRYFEATKKFNIRYDGKGLDFSFPVDFQTSLTLPNGPYWVVAIAGNYFTKRLPVSKVAEVISKTKHEVIIIGGPGEKEEAEQVKALCKREVINLCGKTSLDESAYIIKHSSVILCNDTGMMHLAAALKKPVVSTWGNTVPEFGMTPFFPEGMKDFSIIIEDKNVRCRPCSKLGYSKCPRNHFKCMLNLDSSLIANEIMYAIDKNQSSEFGNLL